jgi:hypothetical protein
VETLGKGIGVDMRPVIFLDFDGVLNNNDLLGDVQLQAHRENWHSTKLDEEMIGEEFVARINQIVEATNAMIVISSAWRRLMSFGRLLYILENKGLKERPIDATPYAGTGLRGDDIETWMIDVGFNRDETPFVIIDDLPKEEFSGLEDHLVTTLFIEGLTEEKMQEAIEVLNGKA